MNTSESNWDDVIEVINRLYESHFEDEDTPNKNTTERIKYITNLFDDIWKDKYELTSIELYFVQSLCILYKFKTEKYYQFEIDNLTRLFINLFDALRTALIHMKKQCESQ